MADVSELIKDIENNYDVDFWGTLLDEYDKKLKDLHKNIDGSKYTEWGLIAIKAIQGNTDAKSLMSEIINSDANNKKIMDEMALYYLVQPILRHYFYRASNHANKQGPPSNKHNFE